MWNPFPSMDQAELQEKSLKPPEGLRFSNFVGISTLPSVGPTHIAGQHVLPYFNDKYLHKQICSWFQHDWMPWQRKTLLCGLTDRCSDNQLEYLATAIEPVFHRDFATAIRGRYPRTPFLGGPKKATEPPKPAKIVKVAGGAAKKSGSKAGSDPIEGLATGLVEKILSGTVEQQQQQLGKEDAALGLADSVGEVAKLPDSDPSSDSLDIGQAAKHPGSDPSDDPMESLAAGLVSLALSTAMGQLSAGNSEGGGQSRLGSTQANSLESFASQLVAGIVHQAYGRKLGRGVDSDGGRGDNNGSLEAPITTSLTSFASSSQAGIKLTVTGSSSSLVAPNASMTSFASSSQTDIKETVTGSQPNASLTSFASSSQTELTGPVAGSDGSSLLPDGEEGKATSDSARPTSQDAPKKKKKSLGPRKSNKLPRVSSKFGVSPWQREGGVTLQLGHPKKPLSKSLSPPPTPVTPSTVTEHHHRSQLNSAAVAGISDFMDTDKAKVLGPLHALRTGTIKKPHNLEDLVPLPRTYKYRKWWESQTERPLVRAKKSTFKDHFKQQLEQIYKWVLEWEDHKRVELVVELLKLCGQDLVKFFAECLVQSIEERHNINNLPDRCLLHIFGFLAPLEITTAAQVCKRWRFIAAQDQLWMVKCKELGGEFGVLDLTTLVAKYGDGDSVDWRLAYTELKKVLNYSRDIHQPLDGYTLSIPDLTRRKPKKHVLGFRIEELVRHHSPHPPATPASDKKLSRRSSKVKSGGSVTQKQLSATSLRELEHLSVGDDQNRIRLPTTSSGSRKTRASPNSGSRTPRSPRPSGSPATTATLGSPRKTAQSLKSEALEGEEEAAGGATTPLPQGHLLQLGGEAADPLPWKQPELQDLDEEEIAMDVRPELLPAKDILGISRGARRLEWKMGEESGSKQSKFAGVVKPIKRARRLQGHMDSVLCLDFDRRRLLTGSADRTIRVWDVRSGRSIRKMSGHKGGIHCLQFDTEKVISGSWDTSIILWDIIKFSRLACLTGHQGTVSCLRFNNSSLISGSHDHTVRLWSLETLQQVCALSHHSDVVTALTHQEDQHLAITASADRTVKIVDLRSGDCQMTLEHHHGPVTALQASGDLIVSGCQDGSLYFWDRRSPEPEAGIAGHDQAITKIEFMPLGPAGARFFTSSGDGSIREWDLHTLTCVRSLIAHKGPVKDLMVSDIRLVSCGDDGTVCLWDLASPNLPSPAAAQIPTTEDTLTLRTIYQ